MNWYLLVLKRYFVFQGRASRSEYWWFTLINALISTVLYTFDDLAGAVAFEYYGIGIFGTLYSLTVLIPNTSVTVRRLHDTDRSAWWLLLSLVPFLSRFELFIFVFLPSLPLFMTVSLLSILGFIVLLIFMLLPSQAEANRYGPVPANGPGV